MTIEKGVMRRSGIGMRSSLDALAALMLAVSLASCGGGGGASPPPEPPAPVSPPPPPVSATVTFLHNFRPDLGDGGQPNGPLLQASDGNFYGTTRSGGTQRCRSDAIPCGAIFRVSADGSESVLYNFGSSANDGYAPAGPLIQGRDGELYGVASSGGDYGGGGIVFKITLDGVYTVLHSFGATPQDGVVPVGGLIQATDGNFYGVTASGGANHCMQIPQDGGNCGTVFKMDPAGSTSILYSFGNSISDGVEPLASLVQASDGNLYGTTANGGDYACTTSNATHNCGTLFRTTLSGTTTILYSFGHSLSDAIGPLGPLIQAADGALYGTTTSGGGGRCGGFFGCGTVFRSTLGGELSIVYSFALNSTQDGYGPSQVLLQAKDGNFYGTTGSGGANLSDLNGTAFRLTPTGVLTTLYSFGPLDTNPSNPLGDSSKQATGRCTA